MTYGIYSDRRTPAEALRQALHTLYDVPLELVYVGPHEELNNHPGPDPVALWLWSSVAAPVGRQ